MTLKHEELVPLADMVGTSFKRDQAELEAENSTLTVEFLNDFFTQTNEVRDLEEADKLQLQQKGITKDLYLAANGMKKELKLFQIVLKKSKLETKVVSTLIKNINSRNMEGALINIKATKQIVEANASLLSSKGMKATFPAFLSDRFDVITKLSNQQNEMMKLRKELTEDNKGSYEKLEEYISDVCNVGRTVYEGKVKADEYTIKKLLAKLHSSGGNNGTNDNNNPPA